MAAVLTTLFTFNANGSNGAGPFAGLLADANGNLFGTTAGGGTYSAGTAFELVNNNGTYTLNTLVNFGPAPTPGAPSTAATQPLCTLIADANGDLYGTTAGGGANGGGTAFELVNNNNGTYTLNILANFDGGSSNLLPSSGLVADANGDLFGTTAFGHIGGPNAQGTVFELVNNNNGTYTPNTLVTFNGPANGPNNGNVPFGGLIADAKGDLFGTTELGGANNQGTVFEIVNNGRRLPRTTPAPRPP